MGRFSNVIGEDYELFRLACPHHDELEETIGKFIVKVFEKSEQKKIEVLEIGCGTGITSNIILNSDSRIHLTALDNEEIMMKQVKNNLKDLNKNRFTLIKSDGLEFLYKQKDNTFDIFASAFTLHNFNQLYRRKVLTEIFRVLKKGGLFINADKYALDDEKEHMKTFNWQKDMIKNIYFKAGREDLAHVWLEHYNRDNAEDLIMVEKESIKQMKEIGYIEIKKVYRKQTEATIIARK